MQPRDTKAIEKKINDALLMLQQEIRRWESYDACNSFLRALEETQACYELTETEIALLCGRYRQ